MKSLVTVCSRPPIMPREHGEPVDNSDGSRVGEYRAEMAIAGGGTSRSRLCLY